MDLLRALLQGQLDEHGYVEAFRQQLADGGYPIRHRLDTVGAMREAGYKGKLGLGKWEADGDPWRILWDVCFASRGNPTSNGRCRLSARRLNATADRPMR